MRILSGRLVRVLVLLGLVAAPALVATPAYADVPVEVTATGPGGEALDGIVWFYATGSGNAQGGSLAGGSYSEVRTEPGSYEILVQSSTMDDASRWYVAGDPDGTDDRAQATSVTFPDVGALSFTITFPDMARVTGHVLDPDGDPVAGVSTFVHRNGYTKQGPTSDADGVVALGYRRAGAILVGTGETASDFGARVDVTVPATGTVDVDLPLVPGARIAGTLTNGETGEPLPHVWVSVHTTDGSRDWGVSAAATGSDGTFTIPKAHVAPALLSFTDPMGSLPATWSGDVADHRAADVLTLAAGQTTSYDAVLTPAPDPRSAPHTLAGVVTDPDDQPLRGITVTAVPTGAGTAITTTSDHGGRWAIDVPDGSYRVQYDAGSGWYDLQLPAWQREQWPDRWVGAGTAVTVAGGVGRDDLDASLHLAGRVDVSVRARGDLPGVVAGLTLVDAAGEWHEVLTPDGSASRSASVKPGSYRALLTADTADGTPLVARWYGGDGRRLATATVFSVGPQGQVTLPVQELRRSLAPTAPPTVTGERRVGGRLSVTSPGVFPLVDGAALSYRWLRGASVVGTGTSYVVRPSDLGQRLTLAVTATHRGLAGTGRTTVDVPRATTAVTGTARTKAGVTRLRLRVTTPGAVPRGKVVVLQAGEIVARGRLREGRLRVVLRDQPRRASYTIRYRGTPAFAPARTVVRARTPGRP